MHLVKQIQIPKNHSFYKECDKLCFASKNLYNQALYRVKNYWKDNKKYLSYYDINRQMVDENQVDYRALPSNVSQQTLKVLHQNYMSFFTALRSYKQSPDKFIGCPQEPNFLNKKKGRFVTTYNYHDISRILLKKGILGLSKTEIRVSTQFKFEEIAQVRIVPKNNLYVIEIVYNKECEPEIISDNYCGIDLGLNNLATLGFNNPSIKPITINGKSLKSINQYYNKKKAKLQSKLTKKNKEGNLYQSSKKIRKLTQKRNNKIKSGLHQASKQIVGKLKHNNVSTVVIGLNKQWKQEINIGKRNNQNFVSIPHSKLIELIKYKAELKGIKVITREESYTSKCSFYDNETIRKHNTYRGTRMKRGLFKAGNGFKYNADLNGALNILRKEFPNSFTKGIEGLMVSPKKIEIYS